MAKLKKLKTINPFSLARLHFFAGGFLGLILGILYSFGGLILDILVSAGLIISNETPGLSYGTFLAFGALIGMPIIFALCGLVLGFVVAILFNIAASLLGGITLDL